MFKKIFAYLFISCACSSMVIDKTHANQELYITNDNIDEDFYNFQPANEGKYSNVSFNGVEINSNFVEQFKKVLPYGCEELSFEGCTRENDIDFNSLFDYGGYTVRHLAILDCNLSADDVGLLLGYLNYYVLDSLDFRYNEGLSPEDETLKSVTQALIEGPCFNVSIEY